MATKTLTARDRFDLARADLAEAGVTFVIDTRCLTPGDAWTAATKEYDRNRLAVTYAYNGHWHTDNQFCHEGCLPLSVLYIGHPYWDLHVAETLAETFRSHGFGVEWDGTGENSVCVRLA